MKRIFSVILIFAILFHIPLTIRASTYNDFLNINDKTQYNMDAYYQELWVNYETNTSFLWNYICGDQCCTYVQIANHFKDNGWYEYATKWTDQELTKERYVEILVNLMTLMDYTTHEMIEKQVNADTLKTFGDYAFDVSEILAGTVSLHSTFGSRITEPMKKIATAMGLVSGAADLTVDTIAAYQYLDWTLQTYENHDLFLSAIIKNTDDDTLRNAAIELSDIVNKTFYCKINAVSDISESMAEYIGKDIFFDTLVLDKMLQDASILDLSESDLEILNLLKDTYSVFATSISYIQDWSVFISDMLGGSSDVMNRYNEMCALTAIREALIKQIESYRSNIKDGSDYVHIGKVCALLKDLVCVNYRGEYCVHEMLVHDGQVFSLVVKCNGEAMSYDEIFEQIKIYTSAYVDAIDSIFPDIECYRLTETSDPVHEHMGSVSEQDLVTSAYTRKCQYTVKKYNEESVSWGYTACYEIPQINLDSDEVRQINAELYNSLYPVIERAASEIFSDGFSVSSEEISYRWAVNGDILSLVVKNCGVPDFGGGTEYYVYNISISTGTRVSNEAVISSAGFSQNEFYESAKQSLKASYASGWDSSNWNDAINQQCEKTISNENIDQSYPYINEKGQLCIIAKRYTLAGAACYWGDFNLVDFEPLPFDTNL